MSRRTPKPPARLDPEVRRAQLLDAATSAIAGQDPAELGLDRIANAAGVSRSLLYAYFGDRGGLVAALYEHHVARLDAHLGDGLTRRPDAAAARRLARRHLTFARDEPAAWHVITATGASNHPTVAAVRRARLERIAAAWGPPTTPLTVRGVLGLLEACCQEWVEGPAKGLERTTRAVTEVLWTGLHPMEPAVEAVAAG